MAVHIRRDRVFEDSFRELHRRNAEEMKNRLYIVFDGEEGQDAGKKERWSFHGRTVHYGGLFLDQYKFEKVFINNITVNTCKNQSFLVIPLLRAFVSKL